VAALPTGTVTFLFTDIEGSTRLLHDLGDRYPQVLADHRRALRAAVSTHDGVEVDTQGDAFFIAFAKAADAVAAARAAQRALSASPVRVRMGIHTGEPTVTPEGYVGIDVHRGARICAAGHGGQILISKTTRDLLDPDTELRDLGEHRLKDLQKPEWLYQVLAPDLEPRFPPLRSLSNTNLPAEASAFIGRQRELDDMSALLGRADVRLLTLSGAGGTGKTRLGIRLAAEFVEQFKNGVFFISLAPVRDPTLVLGTIAQTLGVKEAASEAPIDALRRHLEGKQILLVLDNFEHLLASAPDVSLLLASAAQLKVVVTSRERLRLAGEHEYAVPPLPDDDAVTLFDVRARAAKPSFRVELERAPVAAICRRLDGLPLAVELAAARVKVLQPQALLTRLEQGLPVLTDGPRDVPDRQRTLRATIEWSYLLLDKHEQEVIGRLSVFVGGWGSPAAEQICGATLEDLVSLLDKSLLRNDDGHTDELRFSMLETIREYAGERLETSGEAETVGRRHAHFFAALADTKSQGRGHGLSLAPHIYRTNPQWLEWLTLERANLTTALAWLIEHGETEVAIQLIQSIWRVWLVRGPLRDGQTWTEKVLALEGVERSPDFGWLLGLAADFPRFRGEHRRARELLERSIEVLTRKGDTFRLATCIESLAGVTEHQGKHEEAEALHQQCLSIGREINEPSTIAHALNGLAVQAFRRGDYARMVAFAEEELALNRTVGAGIHEALHNVAEARRHLGRLGPAAEMYVEGLGVSLELGDVNGIAEFFDGLADLAAARGDVENATLLWAASRRHFDEIGQLSWDAAETERGLAEARVGLGVAKFEEVWRTGQALTRDEAVALARRIASDAQGAVAV
jgi:predicted ATPase/class 3 adenylate cyclase